VCAQSLSCFIPLKRSVRKMVIAIGTETAVTLLVIPLFFLRKKVRRSKVRRHGR
jgi:hypothetical protein